MSLGDAAFLLLLWSVFAFLVNRFYVILRYREINVRGAVYSRAGTPILYWSQMGLLVLALLLIGGVALVMTLGAILA